MGRIPTFNHSMYRHYTYIYGGDGIGGEFGAYSQTPTTETEPNPSYLVYSDLEEFYPDALGVTTNTET